MDEMFVELPWSARRCLQNDRAMTEDQATAGDRPDYAPSNKGDLVPEPERLHRKPATPYDRDKVRSDARASKLPKQVPRN